MRLLVYSAKDFEIGLLKEANTYGHQIEFTPLRLEISTVHLASEFDAISIFSADSAHADVLRSLGKFGVQYICLRSTGFDNVDLVTARKLGIGVANVPSYSPSAIAEHAIGLLLAANRKLYLARERVSQYNFQLDPLMGFDLKGKTAAVLGVGNIGRVIGRILHGFGCELLGHDIRPDEESANKGMIFTDLETIAAEAQLVFISLPLNEQTHYLIDAAWLSKLRKHPYIVNVARGKIVRTAAMIDALDNGKVAYYATDVYEKENGVFFYDNSEKGVNDPMLKRLIEHPKVTLTPHQAFVTREAVGEIATTTLRNLDRWSEGKTPSNALC